ncbi:hypothetical protein HK405_002697 [Cladochytrium tenue]|nr:hypothetical protein HK405_002697 [Cladochytrium tenue]
MLSVTGQDCYILWFLHHDVSKLLLKYLVLMQLVKMLAVQLLHGDKVAMVHQLILFVSHGQLASGKHVCDITAMSPRCSCITTSSWLTWLPMTACQVAASVYGRLQVDLQRIDRYEFQVVSTCWQMLLGMKLTAAANPIADLVLCSSSKDRSHAVATLHQVTG